MATTKSLNDVLKREGNNFDLLRLIAASAVIIGHAYALHPQPPLQDGVLSILHFDYSGSLAVKFFFFLSGMLVTNSIINNPNPFQFLSKRALRIFPGLLVCLLVAVFIVGPIFTKFSLIDYFTESSTWSYIKNNFLLMDLQWRLTGVFTESSNGLNGSLWTLPFEALCYIYLAIFYGLGLLKNRHIANTFFVGVIAVSIFVPTHLPNPFNQVTESHILPACFAFGALFANNKRSIPIGIPHAILLCLLAYMLTNSGAFQFLFYIAFFYVAVLISSLPFVHKYLKLPFDASYGIYVYGYMIQQCVHVMFPNVGVHTHQLISLAIAIPIGILSWHYVEKPCIELGTNLFRLSFNWQMIKEKITNSIHQIKNYSQNNYQLLIMTGIAVPVIMCIYWFHWRTTEIYGDDLHQFIKHETTNGILSKINLPLTYGKLRPIHGLVSHLVIEFFQKHLTAYFLFNVGIQALNTFILAMLLNLFLRSPYLSIFISLILGFSRFAFFNITQVLNGGALEGLALAFFLLSLFFIVKVIIKQDLLASQKQKGIIWAIVFANLGMYTHERYIVMLPFILCLILLFPSLRTLTKKQRIGLSLLVVFSIILNVAIKKYIYSIPLDMGTSGVSISISSIFTFLTEGILSIFQVNHGPEYLTGIQFQSLSIRYQILVILLLLCLSSVLALFIKRVYNAFMTKQKDVIMIFYTFLALSVLFFMILLSAFATTRLEQRWLQGSASIFLLMTAIAWSTIPFKKTYVKYASCALFTLLFIRTDYVYLKDGVHNIYLTTAKNMSSSFKKALNNGTIPDSISKLYIWEKNKDAGFEMAIDWTLQKGYFFDFYRNKGKEIYFITPSDINNSANLDSTKSRVLYYNNEISDITRQYLQTRGTDFGKVNAINQLITFNDLDNFITTGFYNNEGSFRWTNGKASIGFHNGNYNLKDSLNIELKTSMPPVCKNVSPQIFIKDESNQEYYPVASNRDGDKFFYKFYFNTSVKLQQIGISSETIAVGPPDIRVLSFPFISLQIKN